MKLIINVFVILVVCSSCNHSNNNNNTENKPGDQKEHATFFPVTDFFKGQIAEIKKSGINPLQITNINKHQDSLWLKMEELNNAFADFLTPEIDSLNLMGLFSEKKFLDETINAFTFTYDPVKPLPDSFLLQRWDVYIEPGSGTVKRIYLLKNTPDHKTLQLSWQTNKYCRIVHISNEPKANDHVEKEIIIKWDF